MRLIAVRPSRAPTPSELADRQAFDSLVAESLARVRKSAESWRNAMSGLVVLVAGSLLISDKSVVAASPTAWKALSSVLAFGGATLALLALWLAASASYGDVGESTYDHIHRKYGSVPAYEIAAAREAARKLALSRFAVGIALPLLLALPVVAWWLPQTPAEDRKVRVETRDGRLFCGSLAGPADGYVVVRMDTSDGRRIRLQDVSAIGSVPAC